MWKKLLSLTLCVSTLLLGGCGMTSNKIRFGTAALGGMYHSFGSAFTQLVSTEDIDCQMEMKTTAGSAANLRLLSDGYIELGIAQMDLTADAYKGTGIFEGKEYQGFKAIAGLYTEACQIVVRADSSIYSLDDLQGKHISIGASESGKDHIHWRGRFRNRAKCQSDSESKRTFFRTGTHCESGLRAGCFPAAVR